MGGGTYYSDIVVMFPLAGGGAVTNGGGVGAQGGGVGAGGGAIPTMDLSGGDSLRSNIKFSAVDRGAGIADVFAPRGVES